MDSSKINELLSKYWNCETSLEEEQQLKSYFRNNNVPEQWKETAALFQYFDDFKKNELDQSVNSKVMETVAPKRSIMRKLVFNSMRIAAGIAVLLAAIWFVRNEIRSNTPIAKEDTYEDPKIAFEETKKALLMISKSFGTAEEKAKKLNLFNEAQKQVAGEQNKAQL